MKPLREIGREESSGRRLYLLELANPDDIPANLTVGSPHFVCLLAWDARVLGTDCIGTVADRLLRAGCVYAVCWGPDCERVHDAFDEVDCQLHPDGPWA